MASYYDDNFGWHEIEDEEDLEFYHTTLQCSVKKRCSICGREVKLLPEFHECNSCMEQLGRHI